MSKNVILIGSGGHAKVVCDALIEMQRPPLLLTDTNPERWGSSVLGIVIKGGDLLIAQSDPAEVDLANGIASVRDTNVRRRVFQTWAPRGFRFVSIFHPSSVIARDVLMGEGVQVHAGAVIQPSTWLGDNVLVNTKSSVDHDCRIGSHCHIAPGATISGFVELGVGVHVGTGATLIQGIKIGDHSTIAAGAVVVHDVPGDSIVKGVPGVVQPILRKSRCGCDENEPL